MAAVVVESTVPIELGYIDKPMPSQLLLTQPDKRLHSVPQDAAAGRIGYSCGDEGTRRVMEGISAVRSSSRQAQTRNLLWASTSFPL